MNGKARGRGWAKPVERAFRDLDEAVDRHPRAAGAYTGRSPTAKPANYETRALSWDEFLAIRDDGLAAHNARPGRETEAAAGRSFDAHAGRRMIATTPVRRLTHAQEALLLLAVESTRVQRSGLFRLAAGKGTGLPANDYWHPDLVASAGRRVVARFARSICTPASRCSTSRGSGCAAPSAELAVGFNDHRGGARAQPG